MTRGPLPAAVYWRRRVFALGLVIALGLIVHGAVSGLQGGPSTGETAVRASGSSDRGSGSARPPRAEPESSTAPASPSTQGPEAATLAEPDGPCADRDVSVVPVVDDAVAGRSVSITLRLRAREAAACTWTLSKRRLAIKVAAGDGEEIWTTRECGGAVPRQDVVVRRDVVSTLTVEWNARRSEEGCPAHPRWVLPGTYTVYAAALGGEPASSEFELAAP